jgi:Domain of unknown function (DUF4157)
MSYQRNNNQKINSGSNSVSEAVALSKGLSFPAVPALQMQGAEVEIQKKKIPAQLMEEEEPLQGKFEAIQRVEEEEPLQGKFETIQRVEEEEPLQGKFETIQKVEEEELLQGKFNTIQKVEDEEPLQGKFETVQKQKYLKLKQKYGSDSKRKVEEEEPLQGKFDAIQKVEAPKDTKQNGLPGNLKSGIENLSGYSMDDVKVHYNSTKPAQLQAHAYAQGTDIHIAPGQEKHLPHEAWHVAQQKQGRVKPTLQMKSGVPVNDDPGLENEADVMGSKALQINNNGEALTQRKGAESSAIIQRNPASALTIATGHSYSKHVVTQKEWGDPPMKKEAFGPIVADVMNTAGASKDLKNGRKAYWKGDTIVIYDPNSSDKGTCFKPTLGQKYYDKLT